MFIPSPMRLPKYFVVILVLVFSTAIFSQQRTTYKILGIAVDGNKSSDANTIVVSTGIKVGDEIQVPGDKTINAIKNLWALIFFQMFRLLLINN